MSSRNTSGFGPVTRYRTARRRADSASDGYTSRNSPTLRASSTYVSLDSWSPPQTATASAPSSTRDDELSTDEIRRQFEIAGRAPLRASESENEDSDQENQYAMLRSPSTVSTATHDEEPPARMQVISSRRESPMPTYWFRRELLEAETEETPRELNSTSRDSSLHHGSDREINLVDGLPSSNHSSERHSNAQGAMNWLGEEYTSKGRRDEPGPSTIPPFRVITEHRGHVAAQKEYPRTSRLAIFTRQVSGAAHGASDTSQRSSTHQLTATRERLSDIDRIRRSNDAESATSSIQPVNPAPIAVAPIQEVSCTRCSSPQRSSTSQRSALVSFAT